MTRCNRAVSKGSSVNVSVVGKRYCTFVDRQMKCSECLAENFFSPRDIALSVQLICRECSFVIFGLTVKNARRV